jgi:Flp pilus assembly protein TadG
MKRLVRRLRTLARDTRANATVEFVIIVPILMVIVFSIYEAGWLMVRTAMLERGVDMAIRDLRLGAIPDPTHDAIKARVCDHAIVIKDCENVLILELTPFDLTAGLPTNGAVCVDRSQEVQPVFTFDPGQRSEIMFVRACAVVEPMFPMMGLGQAMIRQPTGDYAIVAHSAFANEPG